MENESTDPWAQKENVHCSVVGEKKSISLENYNHT